MDVCTSPCYCADQHVPTNEEMVVPFSKHRAKSRRMSSNGRIPDNATQQNSHSTPPRLRGWSSRSPSTAGRLVDTKNKMQDSTQYEKSFKPEDEGGFEYCTGGICSPVKIEKQGGRVHPKMMPKNMEGRKPPLGHLMFDGQFEGGNIAGVRRLEDGSEYDLWLQHDTLNPRWIS